MAEHRFNFRRAMKRVAHVTSLVPPRAILECGHDVAPARVTTAGEAFCLGCYHGENQYRMQHECVLEMIDDMGVMLSRVEALLGEEAPHG